MALTCLGCPHIRDGGHGPLDDRGGERKFQMEIAAGGRGRAGQQGCNVPDRAEFEAFSELISAAHRSMRARTRCCRLCKSFNQGPDFIAT